MNIIEEDRRILKSKTNREKKENKLIKNSDSPQYKKLIKNKNNQYNALEIILEHLDKILEKTKLNESQLQEFKYDQRQILKEMNKIKNYLDKCK